MSESGEAGVSLSPVKERGWKDKEGKEPKHQHSLTKDEKKLKKEEAKEHKRSLSRDQSSHRRSQSRDERRAAQEALEHVGGAGPGPPAADDPRDLHVSSDGTVHAAKLGPLEKLQQKFENVLKGHSTVSSFRGEYTGKVDKDTGRFHGKGTLVTASGDRYVGDWRDGELDGYGQYFGKDEMYEGYWKNGKIDGVGKFKWANGDEYEGTWRDSKAEGRGVYVWKNGDRYEGEWRDNKKWGRGKKTFAHGDEYVGEWRADRPHGTGTYTWAGGGRYEGEWVEGKKQGRGVRLFAGTHDEYVGDWKADEMHGQGTMTYAASGDSYEGAWRDGKRNGTGTLTRRNGDRYRGDWDDDRRHGLGRETFANGDKYEGAYRTDRPEGHGVYVSQRGDRYEGEWRAGKRHGRGVLLGAGGGDRYEGEWAAGERHGFGLLTTSAPLPPADPSAAGGAGAAAGGDSGPLEVEFRDDQNFVRKQAPEDKARAHEAAREAVRAAEEARRLAEAARAVGEERIASSIALDFAELEMEAKPLGEGSYGVVHKAKFRGLTVAVKILKLNQSRTVNQKLEEEFLKEVRMLAELRHPNIILFMGATTKPHFCLVTEFMPRGNLFEYLANRSVAIDDALRLKMARDITLGMAYLHQRRPPVIHKDLKSLNILVDDQSRLKIIDFGLSQVKEAFGDSKSAVIGTPQWCAPELLRNESYDEKVDVYSFGVVLWEMVTRSGPYPSMSPDQVRHEVLTNHLRPAIPSSCPVGLRRLMEFCWSEEPTARPSFAAIIDYLNQYQAQSTAAAGAEAAGAGMMMLQPPQQQGPPAPAPAGYYYPPSAPAARPQPPGPLYAMPAPLPLGAYPAPGPGPAQPYFAPPPSVPAPQAQQAVYAPPALQPMQQVMLVPAAAPGPGQQPQPQAAAAYAMRPAGSALPPAPSSPVNADYRPAANGQAMAASYAPPAPSGPPLAAYPPYQPPAYQHQHQHQHQQSYPGPAATAPAPFQLQPLTPAQHSSNAVRLSSSPQPPGAIPYPDHYAPPQHYPPQAPVPAGPASYGASQPAPLYLPGPGPQPQPQYGPPSSTYGAPPAPSAPPLYAAPTGPPASTNSAPPPRP